MNHPSETHLTQKGLAATGTGSVLLIACGALAREILDLRDINGWTHLDLTCLPAILHNHPERIPDAVKDAVNKNRDNYDQIYLVYADCGTGGKLFDLCKELGIEMVEGPHCYSFFEGNTEFLKRTQDEISSFYLTDFLVRQFDAFVWKPLGLDRHPELRDMYFGNYETLVYQAQTNDPALDKKAEHCAEKLGLLFERRFTGYGELETTLRDWAAKP